MKASELRKYNFVNWRNKPIQIIGNYDLFKICTYLDREDERVTPIPLTEEWIVKFGGEKLEFAPIWQFKSQEGRCVNLHLVHLKSENIGLYEDGVRAVKLYVHSLQNLYFALTGEELTIKKGSSN